MRRHAGAVGVIVLLAVACALLATLEGCAVMHLGRAGGAASEARVASARHGSSKTAVALDAIEESRARAAEEPAEPWWPYRVAVLEAAAGRPAAAESSLRVAIGRDSSYAPALTMLSRALYEQGRHEEALRLLAHVRERRVALPAGERAAVLAGVALHEAALGRDADAREALDGLSRDGRAGVPGVASFLAARAGTADSAVRATQASLHDGPDRAALHNNHGIALLRASDADGAEKEFERAIELDPSRAAPYYNLAILERWYRQDEAAAVKRFQQYWSRSHADPDSLYAELGRGLPPPVAEGVNR